MEFFSNAVTVVVPCDERPVGAHRVVIAGADVSLCLWTWMSDTDIGDSVLLIIPSMKSKLLLNSGEWLLVSLVEHW